MSARPYHLVALLLLAPPLHAQGFRRAGLAYPAPPVIVIDGALGEWNLGLYGVSPPIELGEGSFLEEGTIYGPADNFARIFVAHGPDDLFVAAIVTDDHVVADQRGPDMWRGDMVEVLIKTSVKGGYLHVGFNPAGDAHVFAPAAAPGTIESAARIEASGYVLEARIPYALLGARPLDALAVNFAVRDADPGEAPPAHRVWSGYRHNRTSSFGELLLRGAAAETPPPDLEGCPRGSEVPVDAPLRASGRKLLSGKSEVRLRIISFQSAQASWDAFWVRFDRAQIDRDLDLAQRVGANAIRVFPPFAVFGPQPTTAYLERLRYVVDGARARGMLTIPSLFPDSKQFGRDRWPAMESHLRHMVAGFRNDPAIAMWDLMNEADHGFGLAGAVFSARDVFAWSRHMARALREADPSHLLTIGLAGYFARKDGPPPPEELLLVGEVLSVHWYSEADGVGPALERARSAASVPLVLQEFGATGLYDDEAGAVRHYQAMCAAAEKAGVAGVGAWELFDHPVGTIDATVPRWRETEENHYGIARADGRPKLQAGAFCRCLGALPRFAVRLPLP